MNTTYGALYDIVEQRLKNTDRDMPCSRQAFLFAADMGPGECDGMRMMDMGNEEFFQAVYLGLFNRLPDQSAKLVWKEELATSPDKFREALFDTLLCSPEAVTKGSCLINNQLVPVKYRELTALNEFILRKGAGQADFSAKEGWKDRLYKLYIKLPLPLRKLIRKILRRN